MAACYQITFILAVSVIQCRSSKQVEGKNSPKNKNLLIIFSNHEILWFVLLWDYFDHQLDFKIYGFYSARAILVKEDQ